MDIWPLFEELSPETMENGCESIFNTNQSIFEPNTAIKIVYIQYKNNRSKIRRPVYRFSL